MEKETPHIKYHLIKLIVYTVLAILVFIFRSFHIANLRYFIGTLMLIYAIEEVLFDMLFFRKSILHKHKIYLAMAETTFAIVLIVAPITIEITCIIWATWSILREFQEIKEVIVDLRNITTRILSGLESIVAIVFSVMLILEPGEHHALIHIYLLLVELVLNPIVPLLDELISKQKEKKEVIGQA